MQPPAGAEAPLAPRPSGTFARLTVDNVLANLTVPLAGLVDVAMLGHLDDIRFLAGVALGGIAFDVLYWSFGFLRMATTGTTAQAVGRGDEAEMARILGRGLVLAVLAGTLVVLLRGPLIDATFAILAGTPEVEAAGRSYVGARILGAPAALANLVLIGWFLGRAESRVVLVLTAVAGLGNVALNAWLILGLGWAAYGAGLASMLAQVMMTGTALFYLRGRFAPRRLDRASLFDRRALGALFRLQRDIGVRTLCLVSTFAVFTNLSALLGTAVLAANTLLLRVVTTAAYLIDGVAYATESLAGIAHGRGDRSGLRALLRTALTTGVVAGGALAAAVWCWPGALLGLLTSHDDVVALAVRHVGWLVPVLTVGAVSYVYDGLLLGLTAGRTLRNAMLVAVGLGFAPLAALAWSRGENHLLWLAMTAFMTLRAAALVVGARPLLRSATG